MPLREELEKSGNWLFRWRSYLPFLIIPLLLIALPNSECLERLLGDRGANIWEGLCLFTSLIGFALRCATIGYAQPGTSGRNTKRQRAKVLNTTGIYSIVRHPLYLANFMILLGLASLLGVWWFILICLLMFWLYYERIMLAEEEFLRNKFGASFLDWAEKTPAFWPRFRNWRPPDSTFSLRAVLKGEYSTFFAITACSLALDTLEDFFGEGKWKIDSFGATLFLFGLTSYLVLRVLKKRTTVFNEGAVREKSRAISQDGPPLLPPA